MRRVWVPGQAYRKKAPVFKRLMLAAVGDLGEPSAHGHGMQINANASNRVGKIGKIGHCYRLDGDGQLTDGR